MTRPIRVFLKTKTIICKRDKWLNGLKLARLVAGKFSQNILHTKHFDAFIISPNDKLGPS